MSEAVLTLSGTAAPLPLTNVDTDQIIPARYLKGTKKQGLGQYLFTDLRLDESGQAREGFVLNVPEYAGASFLVAKENFGCGSSREHAPWALKDYGFQAIIAPSFADIFKSNALKNSLLPIALPDFMVETLLERLKTQPDLVFKLDLPHQRLDIEGLPTQFFPMDAFWKTCLLEGTDGIGYSLRFSEAIAAFEAQHWDPIRCP